ncbi:MAG: MFS transporter [Cellvibrionales bacterium TMED148]|mgnify:CR=1 FL=1|nr:MFS transporter [Porticoccaceae bacterium]RPG91542.1 MAG: MFS transporter [Cellvibrionales bacterium TMED148]
MSVDLALTLLKAPALTNSYTAHLNRHFQLFVVIVAAGAIFPLLYLRQNFEISILQSFDITLSQLSNCYALMGLIFAVTYLPSGWLADRFTPRLLILNSLVMTGSLGVWFASIPSYQNLLFIFSGWGISTGLTFWAAHIKIVSILARGDYQGRFFGLLDGGRGLVEAILATTAIWIFASFLSHESHTSELAIKQVIYMYCIAIAVAAALAYSLLDDSKCESNPQQSEKFLVELKLVISRQDVWIAAICILCGYQLFWATYSFSAHLQENYSLTAVTVGSITVAKLWMRPLGAITTGYIGDWFGRERTLGLAMLFASCCICTIALLPAATGTEILAAIVLATGLATYAVRGIYWSTLHNCEIPDRSKGLVIGVMSVVGYLPDIYLPLVNAALLEAYPGKFGYQLYFLGIAGCGLIGCISAKYLRRSP